MQSHVTLDFRTALPCAGAAQMYLKDLRVSIFPTLSTLPLPSSLSLEIERLSIGGIHLMRSNFQDHFKSDHGQS